MANGDNNFQNDPSNFDSRSPMNKFAKEDAKNAQELTSAARTLTEELKDQLGIRSRLNETKRETLNIARDLTRSAQENTIEIGNAGNIERQLAKDRKRALAIERERQDIVENMGPEQIDHARRIFDITSDIEELNKKMAEASEEEKKSIEKQIIGKEKMLMVTLKTADADVQRLAVLQGMESVNNKLIEQREKEAELQQKISDKMGVTGALVKGTGALMERLGMRSGIFQDAMKNSAEEMRKMAEETVRGEKNFSKLEIMLKGFSTLSQGFGKALFDPFTIITAIVSKFFELNKASVEFQNLTGQNVGIQAAHNNKLATAAEVIETMTEFTKETGLNAASVFDSDTLGRMAEAQNLLGLSAAESVKLGLFSKVSGDNFRDSQEAIVAGVNGINEQLGASVAHGQVMRDVANTSEDIAISLGGNAGKIAAAATAARALGLDLQKVNDIADGLLDFEQSIQNELEAQLLTGKNINMNKARELALNNDLEGLAKELSKQGINAAEFANMNRIQQEAVAKSLGLSRNELGKMVAAQAAQGEITKEQAAKMQGMTLEQLEQAEAAESLKKAFGKIAEPLASILNALAPILTVVAKIVSFVAPFAAPIFLAVKGFQLLNSGILGNIKSMVKLLTKTKLFGKFYKGGQFMPGGGRAKAGGQRAGGLFGKVKESIFGKKGASEAIKKSTDATKGATPKKAVGIKSFLTGLGSGLKFIGKNFTNVVKGALAITIAGLALAGSFALGLRMVKDVEPTTMLAFATSLGILGFSLAAIGKMGGSVIKGAIALGILSVALIPAAFAFSMLQGVNAGSMFAFAGALALLGVAAAGLGLVAPFVMAGAGALAVLGLALIPASLAFKMLSGLDMDVVTSFAAGVGVLALTAAGLGLIAPFILAGSFAIAALGLSLMPLASGFAALGQTPIESIIGKLQGLALLAPQLLLVGGALFSIAAGLGAIAVAGVLALPALNGLAILALSATPLLALSGLFGDGDSEDSSMAEISSKLDTLIAAVESGGNVYLDGSKVGETQVIGSYKLA